MREIEIKYCITVTDQDVEDIIVTALEGGIGYWCCLDNRGKEYEEAPKDEPVAITASKILLSGGSLKLIDEVEESKHEMSLDDLLNGIKCWKECSYDTYDAISDGRIDCGMIDAFGADGIIQCTILGDILYGKRKI